MAGGWDERQMSIRALAKPSDVMCGAGAMAIIDGGIGDFHDGDVGGRGQTMSARLNEQEAAKVFTTMCDVALGEEEEK